MSDARMDSIPNRLLDRARQMPNDPAYYVRSGGGQWQPTSWREYADQVRTAAKALVTLGFKPGQRVCILGFNRPEWVVLDIAAMMAGGVPAGIYTTCSANEVQYIIHHAEAEIVLLEDEGQWEKVKEERENLPLLKHVVMMKGVTIDDPLVMSWDEFLAKAEETEDKVIDDALDNIQEDQSATFIYTSGTTGPPKAVELSHGNLAWTALVSQRLVEVGPRDSTVSYLPLSHIAEQMFSIHVPLSIGMQVYFAEALDKVPDNIKEVRPTVLFGVPRVWEKMHAKVQQKLNEAEGAKAKIAAWAMSVGRQVNALKNRSKEPGMGLSMQYSLANKLFFSKVKAAMGMDRLRFGISGAAPIAAEVLEFFASLDITIHEVYGQSEDCGPTSFNAPGDTAFGSVGKPMPGTEVKLGEDGEILVKGPHVFKGYFKDENATNDTIKDGWLHSGDLGAFDDNGFLRIIGRKKEILITAGGKNIAPKNIEMALKNIPLVSQAVVIGERRPYLTALVTLEPDALAQFAKANSLSDGELHKNPQLVEALEGEVQNSVNPKFARVEHVRKIKVLARDFTVDDGELTPSMKIKRRVVNEHFKDEIESLYS